MWLPEGEDCVFTKIKVKDSVWHCKSNKNAKLVRRE